MDGGHLERSESGWGDRISGLARILTGIREGGPEREAEMGEALLRSQQALRAYIILEEIHQIVSMRAAVDSVVRDDSLEYASAGYQIEF